MDGVLELSKAERAEAMRVAGRTLIAGMGGDPALLGPPPAPLEPAPLWVGPPRKR